MMLLRRIDDGSIAWHILKGTLLKITNNCRILRCIIRYDLSQLHDIGLKMETVTSAGTGAVAHWSGTFLFQTVCISGWLLDGMFLSIYLFIRHTPSTDNNVPGSRDMR